MAVLQSCTLSVLIITSLSLSPARLWFLRPLRDLRVLSQRQDAVAFLSSPKQEETVSTLHDCVRHIRNLPVRVCYDVIVELYCASLEFDYLENVWRCGASITKADRFLITLRILITTECNNYYKVLVYLQSACPLVSFVHMSIYRCVNNSA